MKLHILSDLHTEFAPFEWPASKADVVILAGDIGTGKPGLEWIFHNVPSRPVIYVTGNHEFYEHVAPDLVFELKRLAAGSNVHVLENDAVVIGDVVFLGATLWTDFALFGDIPVGMSTAVLGLSDFRLIKVRPAYRRFQPEDALRLHEATLKWLAANARAFHGKKLVVVTHHAPSQVSIAPQYQEDVLSAAFASNLDPFVKDLGADLWIHGHIHHASDYRIGRTRVLANPRGYPGENVPGFDAGLTVDL